MWLTRLAVLQCGRGFARNENGHCTGRFPGFRPARRSLSNRAPCHSLPSPPAFAKTPDEDECARFPFVCPLDRPVCVNTYGSYRCRAKRRCNQGFEPSDDGSACVGEWRSGGRGGSGRIDRIIGSSETNGDLLIWLTSSGFRVNLLTFLWSCPSSVLRV